METHLLGVLHFFPSQPIKLRIEVARLETSLNTPCTSEKPPTNQSKPLKIVSKDDSKNSNTLENIPDTNCSAAHNGPLTTLPTKVLKIFVRNEAISSNNFSKIQKIVSKIF